MGRIRTTLALCLGVVLFVSCSDDDAPPVSATGGRVIEFPGDAPTLQAAIDMARSGDVVRIQVGSHAIAQTIMVGVDQSGVTIEGRSESARGDTRAVLEMDDAAQHAIVVAEAASGVTIRGIEIRGAFWDGVHLIGPDAHLVDCRIEDAGRYAVSCPRAASNGLIERNLLVSPGIFGVHCVGNSRPEIVRNTIVDSGDCGIFTSGALPMCRQNIIHRSAKYGFACFSSPLAELDCNVVYASENADYSPECTPGENDIQEDPLFCEETGFSVRYDSPCAVENNGCGWIGAVQDVCENERDAR